MSRLVLSRTVPTLASAVLAASVTLTPATADVYQLRPVAMTGQSAPGVFGGGEFVTLGTPRLNVAGQVVFAGTTNGGLGSSGIWRSGGELPSDLDMLIGAGYPVPGAPGGVNVRHFDTNEATPLITDGGDVALPVPVTGVPTEDDTAVLRHVDGAFDLVALVGEQVPGAAPGVHFDGINSWVSMNESGLVAFTAWLDGPGVTELNDETVMAHGFGGVGMRLREGQAAPGIANTVIDDLAFWMPTIANDGSIAVVTLVDGAQNGTVGWRGWPGAFEVLAARGDVTEEGNEITSLGDFWGAVVTDDGAIVGARTDDGGVIREGLYRSIGGALETIAVEGMPGPLGTYDLIDRNEGFGNGAGDVAFSARFVGGGLPASADSAVLRSLAGGGAPEVVLREGDAAVGYWGGVELDDLSWWYADTIIADDGTVFVRGRVRGPGVTLENDTALWRIDRDGTVHFVIREGQMIDPGDGFARPLESFGVAMQVGAASGRRPGINVHGDVGLRLLFADDVQAVVVATAPAACPGDLDHDGDVDFDDLLIVLAGWGQPGPIGEGGDATRDGLTDFDDLLVVLANWGNACPQ